MVCNLWQQLAKARRRICRIGRIDTGGEDSLAFFADLRETDVFQEFRRHFLAIAFGRASGFVVEEVKVMRRIRADWKR